jgi:hypothetical protein
VDEDFIDLLGAFADEGVRFEDFVRPDMVVELGLPPRRIDLMTGITGVSFPGAWAERIMVFERMLALSRPPSSLRSRLRDGFRTSHPLLPA